MTYKLYRDQGDTTPLIYLTDEGKPALATVAFEEGKTVPAVGRKFVGTVSLNDFNDARLADPSGLTPLGQKYCAAFGVATNYQSFVKFVSNPSSQRAAFYQQPERSAAPA